MIGWRAAISVGTDAQGRPVRRWISGKTQGEVQDALRRLQSELHQGLLSPEGELTVAELLDQWLGYKEREGVKPNALRSYRDTARLYLKPQLGRTKLEKLRPLDIERLLGRLRQDGKSAAQMAYTLRVLKMALKQAVLWQLVARNVADAVHPPRRHSPEFQVWTAAQAAAFLQVSATHRLHAAFFLALMTGMRRGEILGLKWADIDWERRHLRVRHNLVEIRGEPVNGKMHAGQPTVSSVRAVLQTPKTNASRRNVALSPGTLQKLREHQQRQEHERAAPGAGLGRPGLRVCQCIRRPDGAARPVRLVPADRGRGRSARHSVSRSAPHGRLADDPERDQRRRPSATTSATRTWHSRCASTRTCTRTSVRRRPLTWRNCFLFPPEARLHLLLQAVLEGRQGNDGALPGLLAGTTNPMGTGPAPRPRHARPHGHRRDFLADDRESQA